MEIAMYGLYEIKKANSKYCKSNCQYTAIETKKITPEITGNSLKGRIISLYWNLITIGKAKVYLIRNEEGKIIHSSCVIPNCYKFPFLRGKGGYHDIEIGPCVTVKEYRGLNLYPYVLSNIVNCELGDEDIAYMLIKDSNKPSICGVTKVGFHKTAEIRKDRIGRHVIAKHYNSKKENKLEIL